MGSPHVVLVEADAAYARTVRAAFEARGCTVAAVEDGDALRAEVARERPAVIVLSAELSTGSGFALCNKLKRDASLASIPVVLVAGEHTPKETLDDHALLRTRAQDYALRNIDPNALAERCAKYWTRSPGGIAGVSAGFAVEPAGPRASATGVAGAPRAEPEAPAEGATEQPRMHIGFAARQPAITPEDLKRHDATIEFMLEGRRWVEAVAALEQRLVMVPAPAEKARSLLRLMKLYRDELGDAGLAVRCAERALELEPGAADAVAYLREAYASRHDKDRLAALEARYGAAPARGTGGASAGASGAPAGGVTRWAHLVLTATHRDGAWTMTGAHGEALASWAAITAHVNDLGEHGWELVGTAALSYPTGAQEFTFSFKRPRS